MSGPRSGITTGACAAAAARAAVQLLCGQGETDRVELRLPGGQRLEVPVLYVRQSNDAAVAAVRKDAGDDPDVTHGLEVVVSLTWSDTPAIEFAAGQGVGTVTKPGLQIPPGQPAINPVPREMIARAVREVTERPLRVEVSIPGGRQTALRTFNPRLGIVGGLSILGTTGIVRPYCRRALEDAIRLAFKVAAACGVSAPILVPGNIGAQAAGRHFQTLEQQVIEVANQWGFALDRAAEHDFRSLLLVGHPGKLAKLIRGEWDTHSSRSRQAAGLVAGMARELFSKTLPPSETVEGVFQSLAREERRLLGDETARRIRAAVDERIERTAPVAVFLIDMAGDCLGTSGDLAPWR